MNEQTNFEEAITVGDQLSVVRDWLTYMQACDRKENLSYEEVAEIQAVYDLVKNAIY